MDIDPSTKILGSLATLVVLGVLLYFLGVVRLAVVLVGRLLGWLLRTGFRLWDPLLGWMPWPVYLALVLGLLAYGVRLGTDPYGPPLAIGLIVLHTGVLACLACMSLDLEQSEVERGYKTLGNPQKGQELARDIARHGHRGQGALLLSAAVAVIGGFALINKALHDGPGDGWYDHEKTGGRFIDFLAYALIYIYRLVDLLDLASKRDLFNLPHVRPVRWPASMLMVLYQSFFTLVLVQRLVWSLRRSSLLYMTIRDFWSPHLPIQQRARSQLPLFGPAAVGPFLQSVGSADPLTKEEANTLAKLLAEIGPPAVPILVKRLSDEHPFVRAVAAETLGLLGAAGEIPRLAERSVDPSDLVRQRVFEALGHLGATHQAQARGEGDGSVRHRAGWGGWLAALRRTGPGIDLVGLAVNALRRGLADESAAARATAVEAMGRLGRAAAAATPAVLELLKGPDIALRCRAVEAAVRLNPEGPAVIAALADLLDESPEELLTTVARALGQLGAAGAPAVPRLVDLLYDSREAVRESAAAAINRIGILPEEALARLEQELAHADNLVRAQTAQAIATIGPAARDLGPVLLRALSDPNEGVRAQVVAALGKVGVSSPQVVEKMARVLRGSDTWVTSLAAEALGEMGESAVTAVPALVEAVGHTNPQVRLRAAEALGRVGPTAVAAIPALLKAAQDVDVAVRQAAVTALGLVRRKTAPVLGALRNSLADPEPTVRAAAVAALARMDRLTEANAVPLLHDPSDLVQIEALRALAQLDEVSRSTVEQVCQCLLTDVTAETRAQAAQALGQFGVADGPVGPALRQAALTAEAPVRLQALLALAVLQPPEALDAFCDGMNDANPQVRKVASAGWRRAGAVPESALPVLVAALRDTEPAVRANAAHALGRLDELPAEAVRLLMECLADPSDGVRLHAVVALGRSMVDIRTAALAETLGDANPRVALAAARALLEADPQHEVARQAVVAALRSDDGSARSAAENVVALLESDLREELKLAAQATPAQVPRTAARLDGDGGR